MGLVHKDSPKVAVFGPSAGGYRTVIINQADVELSITLSAAEFDTWREAFGYEI